MQINEPVQAIVDLLLGYSENRVSDPSILAMLLQHAGDAGLHTELGALCFRAKHLSRVFDTMGKQTPESDLHAKLQEEFSASVREFHTQLGTFVGDAPTELHETIVQQHLAVTPEALHKLMHLARDLEWLKNWELDMTQQSGDA